MFRYTRAHYDPLQAFSLFRRRMDHLIRELDTSVGLPENAGVQWPKISLSESDEAYMIEAEVPGLSVDEIDVRVTTESVTLAGTRSVSAPEGYSVHRQERRGAQFSRSFVLPTRIEVEAVAAAVKDGILTVTLPKHAEAKPRTIKIEVH